MTPEKKESSDTLRTTKTMRQKAKLIGRCVITFLKLFRVCCREKKTTNNKTISI